MFVCDRTLLYRACMGSRRPNTSSQWRQAAQRPFSLRSARARFSAAASPKQQQLSEPTGKLSLQVPLALAEAVAILCAAAFQLAAAMQLLRRHSTPKNMYEQRSQQLVQSSPTSAAARGQPADLFSLGTGVFIILAMMLGWLRRGMLGPR